MKVYANQKIQFDSQEVFRRLNRETEIKCIDFRECSTADRQLKIAEKAKLHGTLDIAFVCNGTHLRLHFFHWSISNTSSIGPNPEYIDFEKEPGRLHFKSPVIYNGVCVICVGYINLTKFDGMAKLEFDPTFAQYEIDRASTSVNTQEENICKGNPESTTRNSAAPPAKVKFEPTAHSPSSSQ